MNKSDAEVLKAYEEGRPWAFQMVDEWIRYAYRCNTGIFTAKGIQSTQYLFEEVFSLARLAFSEAMRNRTYRFQAAMRTFIVGITKNKMLDIRRRELTVIVRNPDPVSNAQPDDESGTDEISETRSHDWEGNPGEDVEKQDLIEKIMEIIKTLPPKDQKLKKKVFFDQKSHPEIAREEGDTSNNIKQKVWRNNKTLREEFKRRYGETFS